MTFPLRNVAALASASKASPKKGPDSAAQDSYQDGSRDSTKTGVCLRPKSITVDGPELGGRVCAAANCFPDPHANHSERLLWGQVKKGVKTLIQEFSFHPETLERTNVTRKQERRRVYRYKVVLPLGVRVQTSSGKTDWPSGETRNVSAWGVYFVASQPLARGTKLILALSVPRGTSGDGALVFRVRARVVRLEDVYQNGAHFAGIAAEIEHFCA